MDERERRIGLNEVLFREVNEAVSDISGEFDAPEFEIVCECGKLECSEKIEVTREAYAALREDALQFAVVPGHQIPDVESVIADEGGYYIVRKEAPAARELAERTDPNN
jgi:hypothetical protein